MGFYLDGYILRPARIAPANAPTTSEATTGVVHDHVKPQDYGYQSATTNPIDVCGLMYQSAVLNRPTPSTDEYCVWAATTGSLSTPPGTTNFLIEGGSESITASGSGWNVIRRGEDFNGTRTFLVQDPKGKDIRWVATIYVTIQPTFESINDVIELTGSGVDFWFESTTGVAELTTAGATKMNGGFSEEAGDTFTSAWYSIAPPTFWWCRNDAVTARFGWDGKNQRWAPYQGSGPSNLGILEEESSFTLSPKPTRFTADGTTYLPGDPATSDGYALLRVGLAPDSSAAPIKTLVVQDSEAAAPYSFSGILPDAIVGEKNGILQFNPNAGGIIELRTGLSVWYNPETFVPTMDGDLGRLDEAPENVLVLSPIPGPTDHPFLRYGWRRHLGPRPYPNDASLPDSALVASGTFAWSMTTGKVVLSEADIEKGSPGTAGYLLAYLGAHIYYDGVSMTQEPVPLRAPVPLQLDDGTPLDGVTETIPIFANMYVPRAQLLPFPGVSGVELVPDNTGTVPGNTTPETRPNGSGLIRTVTGIGDSFVFAASIAEEPTYAFADLVVEEYEQDLSKLEFTIPNTEAEMAVMEAAAGPAGSSLVQFKRRGITDSGGFFAQAQMMPCVYAPDVPAMAGTAIPVWCRNVEPFVLEGNETLPFYLGATSVIWTSSTLGPGTFTAKEVADSIRDACFAVGVTNAAVTDFRGRISIGVPGSGVEIGWNTDPFDLSGQAALGFLPGWSTEVARWLPDNGMSFGLFRSPENVNAKEVTPDIAAVGVINAILTESIPAVPFMNLSIFPFEDVPGYAPDVHFRVVQGLNIIDLKNYDGLYYDFVNDRVSWTGVAEVSSTAIQNPASRLQLGASLALPDTVSSSAMEPLGNNYGLYLKEPTATATTELVLGDDFLLPGNGGPGQALLITPVGQLVLQGAAASFIAGHNTISDLNTVVDDWLTIYKGYLLRVLNGDAEGVYTVTANYGTHLEVSPNFPASAGPTNSLPYAQWRIYEGFEQDVYDPAVVADVQQEVFNHFATEPFIINTLSLMGVVGTTSPLSADAATALGRGRVTKVRFTTTTNVDYVAAEQASVTVLERGTLVGAYSQTGMVIPDVADSHYTPSATNVDAFFAIRIGPSEYSTANGNLGLVNTFTEPLTGDVIEVGRSGTLIEGQISAGSDVDADGETAYYDQVPLDPSLIPAATCEMNPNTGDITLNASDATTHNGKRAYFVEQMITENRLDVTSAPLTGSIMFNEPLRTGQLVEVDYYQADDNGDKALDDDGNTIHIVEYLPLIVRLEEATRVDATTYTFNPEGKTYSSKVEPFVWVGVELQNYGGVTTCVVDGAADEIRFAALIDETDTVKINYGVLEAFGGEQAYSVSTPPVFRKPFFLEVAQEQFTLDTDRTSDFVVGALFLIGTAPFYVKAAAYDAVTDATTVDIWPPSLTEVGSRAPGGDAPASISAVPVAITVDPDGAAIAAGGAAGFLMEFPDAIFLPVDRGALSISFYGDYREYTQPQHLIEIGGYPFIVAGSALSADGRYTVVTLANPSPQGFSWDSDPVQSDSIRISVRSVYLPGSRIFTGISPFLNTEEYEAFILGKKDAAGNELPGISLAAGIHFTADPTNGQIVFNSPTQPSLQGGERLLFRYTRIDSVLPVIVDGAQYNPIYRAKSLSVLSPSMENGLLGSTIAAKFTYSNPDTFYCRVLPLVSYLPDVSAAALAKVSSSAPSGGPLLAFPGAPINYKEGNLGLRGTVRDANNLDQAGRAFLEFFNAIIVTWEQVLETIDGRIIGDRDGKFRLFVGHGKPYTPPGYEDIYTGDLNSRNLWRLVVEEWADPTALAEGYIKESDGIYGPTTYVLDTHGGDTPGDVDGWTKSGGEIGAWIEFQRSRVKNDIDDRVLTGLKGGTLLAILFPWLEVDGKYEFMWQPHDLSRIYPEQTLAFTRLFPGLTADFDAQNKGYYSAGRVIEVPGPEPGEVTDTRVSTRNTVIGNVTNPVFPSGVPNISDINVRNRYPRARIWAYYPEGDADLDAAMTAFDAGFTATVGKATFVITPLPFSEFPVDGSTGFPDVGQLITNGGTLADGASGDFGLSTPGFEANSSQLRWGKPDGVTGTIWGPNGGWSNPDVHTNVFVDAIQLGCIITVNDGDGNVLAGSSVQDANASLTYTQLEMEQGDTLWCGPKGNPFDIPDPETEEPDLSDIAAAAKALEDYRVQFDIGVNRKKGKFIDKSLSKGWANDESFPFNMQDFLSQVPPTPLTAIEADVSFTNTGQPVQIPALKGEALNDSGDVSIPYLASSYTELAILGEAAAAINLVFDADCFLILIPAPICWAGFPINPNEFQYWRAIYPNEIADAHTLVAPTVDVVTDTNPNVLYTSEAMQPVTSGTYVNNSGEGSARPYDFMFVEVDQPEILTGALLPAATGILSVADVRSDGPIPTGYTSALEMPRFVTGTRRDEQHNYTAYNAWAGNTSDGVVGPGVVSQHIAGAFWETFIDFSSVGGLILDDGFGGGNGGLWHIINLFGNAIRIEFYSPDPAYVGDPLQATLIIGSPSIGSPVFAINEVAGTPATQHRLTAAGLNINAGASGGPMGNQFVLQTDNADGPLLTALGLLATTYYDFTISVDTYITFEIANQTTGVMPQGSGLGSNMARIQRDRLTFSERYSFANALDRNALPQNGDTTHSMGLQLNVWQSPMRHGGAFVGSDVNACAYNTASGGINGGTWAGPVFLTFKNRTGPSPDGTILAGVEYVGTYTDATADGAGDEEGLVRAMSFEYGNEATNYLNFPSGTDPVEGIRISVASSSDAEETDLILHMQPAVFPDSGDVLRRTADFPIPATTPVWSPRTWVQENGVFEGAVSNVLPGDIMLISGGISDPECGSVKTGTYLVRHAIEGDSVSATYGDSLKSVTKTVLAGEKGWLDLRFPLLKSIDSVTNQIVLEEVSSYLGKNLNLLPVTGTSGEFFLILKAQYTTYDSTAIVGTKYTMVADCVYRIDFSGAVYDAEKEELTATLDPASVVDAVGAVVSGSTFYSKAVVGKRVSYNTGTGRHSSFPIRFDGLSSSFPTNNVVGYWEGTGGVQTAVCGFSSIFAGNHTIFDSGGSSPPNYTDLYWDWQAAELPAAGPPPPPYDQGEINYRSAFNMSVWGSHTADKDLLNVVCNNPLNSTAFIEEKRIPIYSTDDGQRLVAYNEPGFATPVGESTHQAQGVPEYLRMRNDAHTFGHQTAWNRIHFEKAEVEAGVFSAANNVLTCMLPGDTFQLGTDMDPAVATAGYWALAGVFFEPSIPFSTITDTDTDPRVVAASYPLTGATAETTKIGARRWEDHDLSFAGNQWADTYAVARRIRRFHDVNTNISAVLKPLRYVYETRWGYVDQLGAAPVPGALTFAPDLVPFGTATQLGDFGGFVGAGIVNINAGDVVRLLDADGVVVDTAEIRQAAYTTLWLRTPGWTASLAALQSAVTFEVYLEQAAVPHQQSHDQLLDLLTDVKVRSTRVDYPGGAVTGGFVDEANKIKDDTLTGTWGDEGVQKGDYIVVDPAGTLYIEKEQGARAVGDASTVGRVGGNYTEGAPSELDDNRGFYLVEEVGPDYLMVSGASRFCGGDSNGDDDVIFGTAGTSDYVLLPTVHESLLNAGTGGREGQQDLRLTAPAVLDGAGDLSYKARDAGDSSLYKSLGPFGYRIIRTTPVFSKDATELVLFQRARFLSWMEEIQESFDKGGTYYIFQKDDHITELPSATDPTAGLGVFTNEYLTNLSGETDGAPFENCSDCVSILDRRFWVLDYRLDSEANPLGVAYTAFVTNGENQRPVLLDYIADALDNEDKFREQRFSWIMFRADRTEGSIIVARREEDQLPSKIRKQRALALQRKAFK